MVRSSRPLSVTVMVMVVVDVWVVGQVRRVQKDAGTRYNGIFMSSIRHSGSSMVDNKLQQNNVTSFLHAI